MVENTLLELLPQALGEHHLSRLLDLAPTADGIKRDILKELGRSETETITPGWPHGERPTEGQWAITLEQTSPTCTVFASVRIEHPSFDPWWIWADGINLSAPAVVLWGFAVGVWGLGVQLRMHVGPSQMEVGNETLERAINDATIAPRFFDETESQFLARASVAYRAGVEVLSKAGCRKLHNRREVADHCRWLLLRRLGSQEVVDIAKGEGTRSSKAVSEAIRQIERLIGITPRRRGRKRKFQAA